MPDFPGSSNVASSTPLMGAPGADVCEADFARLAEHGVVVTARNDYMGGFGFFDVTSHGSTTSMTRKEIADLAQAFEQIDAASTAMGAPADKTEYHPGVNHDHQPSGRWGEFVGTLNDGGKIEFVCSQVSPANVVRVAAMGEMMDKKIAKAHLEWYFKGKGADFNENANVGNMMRTDAGVQQLVKDAIPKDQTKGTYTGHVEVTQDHYVDQDFRYAFGAIDRLDFKVDFDNKTIKVWFQDRYEWHPVGTGHELKTGDVKRETNCVHAAAVELKKDGARDYWMKGEATLKLDDLGKTATRKDNFVEENPAGGLPFVQKHTGL